MRIRKQWIMVLIVASIPGLLWSMEESQAGRRRGGSQTAKPEAPSDDARELKIFVLQYQQADQLARIIEAVIPPHEATIAVDGASHKLIVAASPRRMEQIDQVIDNLDAEPVDDSDFPQMMYRIYMLELPSGHDNLKPFSLVLEGTSLLRAAPLLDALQDPDVRIGFLSQEPEDAGWQKWELTIEGQAASNESVKRVLEKIPESQIKELRWNDEVFPPPVAQVAQLPDGIRKHIQQLLGQGVQTAGYWFGNLSVPGTVQAPIGPWVFEMSVDRSTQENEVELEIAVLREQPSDSGQTWQILGNSVRSHITKPVIIGYNRDHYGTRVMGAMVIVPEVSRL